MANMANDIQHQIDDQIRMREGAMKLMSACSTLKQALETSKNLLTINARILGLMSALQKKKEQHVLKEYNRQRSSVYMDSSEDCCPGRIAMSDIRVPLMWKDNVHFSGKTGDQSYYAFALIRCGDQVRDTSLYEITSADTDMYFAETLIFEDLLPDLKMEFEVYYTVITSSEAHPIHKAPRASITIRSSSRRQAHFNAPKFCLAGHVQLCVDDISSGMISRDLTMGGKGASGVAVLGDFKEFPIHPLELWGQFCCELAAQPKCMSQKTLDGCCQVKMGDSWSKYYLEIFRCHINGWKDKLHVEKTSPEFLVKLDENMKVSADDTGGGSCILNIISQNRIIHTFQFLNETDFMNWKFALRKEIHNARQWKVACLDLMHIQECKKSRLSIPSTASFYDQIDIGDEPFTYPKAPTNGTLSSSSLSNIKENPEITVLDEVFHEKSTSDEEIHNSGFVTKNVISPNHTQTKGSAANATDTIPEEDKLTTFPDVVLQVMEEEKIVNGEVSSSASTSTSVDANDSEMNKENVAHEEQPRSQTQEEKQTLIKTDVSINEAQHNGVPSTLGDQDQVELIPNETHTDDCERTETVSAMDTELVDSSSGEVVSEPPETRSVQGTERVDEIVTDLDSQDNAKNDTNNENMEVECRLLSDVECKYNSSDVEMASGDAESTIIEDVVCHSENVSCKVVETKDELKGDTVVLENDNGTDLDNMESKDMNDETSGRLSSTEQQNKQTDVAVETSNDSESKALSESVLDPSNKVATSTNQNVETLTNGNADNVTISADNEVETGANDIVENSVSDGVTDSAYNEAETVGIIDVKTQANDDVTKSDDKEVETPIRNDKVNIQASDNVPNSENKDIEIPANANVTNEVEPSSNDEIEVSEKDNVPNSANKDAGIPDSDNGDNICTADGAKSDNSLVDDKMDHSVSIDISPNVSEETKGNIENITPCDEKMDDTTNSEPSEKRTTNDLCSSQLES